MKYPYTYIEEDALCIKRIRKGRGFAYYGLEGDIISDQANLNRIKKLAIPPMWTKVRICKDTSGHIQATGRDLKERKQYIYHENWEKIRQEEKFKRMSVFGKTLPKLRRKVEADLKIKGWPKDKVLALLVAILDETGIRIGNKKYENQNKTYGLTTLRRKHISVEGKMLLLSYKGKSKKEREVTIEDRDIIKLVKKVSEIPGYELFKYMDNEGVVHPIDSHDVLEYIRKNMGEEFSCKDFRTWVGSRLAIELFPQANKKHGETPKKKLETLLVCMVAEELGNTPSICKGYYIHPLLLSKVNVGMIPLKNPFRETKSPTSLDKSEKLLLKLLDQVS